MRLAEISSDLIALVWNLLPGFLAAWIFYGLTAHRPPAPFERIVKALIFSALARLFVVPLRLTLFALGRIPSLAEYTVTWNDESQFIASICVAAILGLLVAWLSNSGKGHELLIRLKITKNTAYPSEWYGAFNCCKRWVYLHLKDGRQLFGWPYEFPDHPDEGHIFLQNPHWVKERDNQIHHEKIVNVDYMLVPAIDVQFVQFIQDDSTNAATESINGKEQTSSAAEIREKRTSKDSSATGQANTNGKVPNQKRKKVKR